MEQKRQQSREAASGRTPFGSWAASATSLALWLS